MGDSIDSNKAAAAGRSARIVGLDALRALLLSYGVLVHVSNLRVAPIFHFIEISSSLFRIPAFFFLSGLLAALTSVRPAPTRWLGQRMMALGIPLLFGLAVLNPLFFALHARVPARAFMVGFVDRNRFVWHLHLWFLVALIAYTLIAFAIRAQEVRRGSASLELAQPIPDQSRFSPRVLAGLLFFCLVQAVVVTVCSRLMAMSGTLAPLRFLVTVTVANSFFYLLGFLLPRSAALRQTFTNPAYALIGLLGMPTILGLAGAAPAGLPVIGFVDKIGRAAIALAFILAVVPVFYRLTRISSALAALAKASYTLYLIHLLAISALLHGFAWLGITVYPAALLTGMITIALGLAVHFKLCEQIPLARLLLNGRLPAGATRGTAALPSAG